MNRCIFYAICQCLFFLNTCVLFVAVIAGADKSATEKECDAFSRHNTTEAGGGNFLHDGAKVGGEDYLHDTLRALALIALSSQSIRLVIWGVRLFLIYTDVDSVSMGKFSAHAYGANTLGRITFVTADLVTWTVVYFSLIGAYSVLIGIWMLEYVGVPGAICFSSPLKDAWAIAVFTFAMFHIIGVTGESFLDGERGQDGAFGDLLISSTSARPHAGYWMKLNANLKELSKMSIFDFKGYSKAFESFSEGRLKYSDTVAHSTRWAGVPSAANNKECDWML